MLNLSKKKKRYIFKSIVSFLLIFSIIFTSAPTGAFVKAAGTESEGNTVEAVQTTETEPYIIGEDVSRRSENEKHFIMSDGTRVAALYDTTVHYKDEQGEFKEVDNSFESLNINEYQTKSGKHKVKLAKKASAKKLVTLDVEGHTVSWGFEGANKVKAQVKQTEESEEKFSAKNVNGIMYYEEAFDNVDLEYIVNSDTIKESIILKTKAAQNEFEINYNIGKLEPVQKDSKTIELLSDGEVIYTISAPVMFDSADNYSSDITLEIVSQKTVCY
ncbi:MAG: hypothetical protein IJE01_03295 [Clostridia bacterium]|nr:hypothetical protein [Clostridia bacterium]